MKVKYKQRAQVDHVWVAEVAYKHSRWITLWNTCSKTRTDCAVSLLKHPNVGDYVIRRFAKFSRVPR